VSFPGLLSMPFYEPAGQERATVPDTKVRIRSGAAR
jgi:hypothetical protein